MENGSHVWVNGDGALAIAVVKVAADDLVSVFEVNSGYALSESGSSLTCPSLCQICPYWSHCWTSLGYSRTHDCGNK